MRRQMRVMAGHNVEGSAQMSASQIQSKRIKWNTETIIIISISFIICWFPNNIYFTIGDNTAQTSNLYVGYFFTVLMAYLNSCMIPFIYALKHDAMKQNLAGLIICHKGVTVETDSGTGRNTTGGTQHIQVHTTHQWLSNYDTSHITNLTLVHIRFRLRMHRTCYQYNMGMFLNCPHITH